MRQISENGVKLIRKWEGSSSLPYQDVAGNWTIGVGHLLTKDELSTGRIKAGRGYVSYGGLEGLSDYYITEILERDLKGVEKVVNKVITAALNQNQFDALVSFTFNVGNHAFKKSTLAKVVNRGEYAHAPVQFKRWKYAGGKIVKGLINRRNKEIRLWNKV